MSQWRNHGKKISTLLGDISSTLLNQRGKSNRRLGGLPKQVAASLQRAATHTTKSKKGKNRHKPRRSPASSHPPKSKVTRRVPGNRTSTYNVNRRGLPTFSYDPVKNDQADPGEVIWTWIPYSDDPSIGKDRPALVLGLDGDWLIASQLTSKDHDKDREQENAAGRYWLKVGTGDWDRKHRTSFVRLDRLMRIDPDYVRREGGRMPYQVFTTVVEALTRHHNR